MLLIAQQASGVTATLAYRSSDLPHTFAIKAAMNVTTGRFAELGARLRRQGEKINTPA